LHAPRGNDHLRDGEVAFLLLCSESKEKGKEKKQLIKGGEREKRRATSWELDKEKRTSDLEDNYIKERKAPSPKEREKTNLGERRGHPTHKM